ncbi:MAG: aminotransferase class I/II-fold pyridoxal phosphate-dependent enzyme [bacterium]
MTLSPLAAELNARLDGECPAALRMLSARGRAAYFPHKGILGQSAEAKGKRINATIGVALEEDGRPLVLGCVAEQVELAPGEQVLYAPSFGKPTLRQRWASMIRAKNPGLAEGGLSLPVVTCALTHGLSMAAELFLDPGDRLILPDLYWGNYRLIFQAAYGAVLDPYPTFVDGRFNVAGLAAKLAEGGPGKRVILLNFPNNPTGYSPTESEAIELVRVIGQAAAAGHDIVVLIDDAYFGLVFEAGILDTSIFVPLSTLAQNVLAVKIDGPTKEDYVWGFRVGFLTYGMAGATRDTYSALEDKTAGVIRGNVSNAPNLSQSLLMAAYDHPDYAAQKAEKHATLRRRYEKVVAVLAAHPEFAESFTPLPFNSGYFMCVRPVSADAEAVRKLLLAEYDTGVIATDGLIRLAFSSTPTADLEDLFANVDAACRRLARG